MSTRREALEQAFEQARKVYYEARTQIEKAFDENEALEAQVVKAYEEAIAQAKKVKEETSA
jgi:hypothetical protein